MAKNKPNKPDDGKAMPANETPAEQTAPVSEPLAADKQAETPEVAADKAATRPGPGDDVVVSFDKINEIISEKKAAKAQEAEQPAQETPAPEPPPEPREAPRSGEQEQIVYVNLSELFPFKDHPFEVKNDDEMRAMVESVKDKGVTQAAIVRPREDAEPFYRNR